MLKAYVASLSSLSTSPSIDLLQRLKEVLSFLCTETFDGSASFFEQCKKLVSCTLRFSCTEGPETAKGDDELVAESPKNLHGSISSLNALIYLRLSLFDISIADYIVSSALEHLANHKICTGIASILLCLCSNSGQFRKLAGNSKSYSKLVDLFQKLLTMTSTPSSDPALTEYTQYKSTVTKLETQSPIPPVVQVLEPVKNDSAANSCLDRAKIVETHPRKSIESVEDPGRLGLSQIRNHYFSNQPISRSLRRLHIARSSNQTLGLESMEPATNATSQKNIMVPPLRPSVPRLNIGLVHEPISSFKIQSRSSRRADMSASNRSIKYDFSPAYKCSGLIEHWQQKKAVPHRNPSNELGPLLITNSNINKGSMSWLDSETRIDAMSSIQDQRGLNAVERMKVLASELGECCLAADLAALLSHRRECVLPKIASETNKYRKILSIKSDQEEMVKIVLNLIALIIWKETVENVGKMRPVLNIVYLYCLSQGYCQQFKANKLKAIEFGEQEEFLKAGVVLGNLDRDVGELFKGKIEDILHNSSGIGMHMTKERTAIGMILHKYALLCENVHKAAVGILFTPLQDELKVCVNGIYYNLPTEQVSVRETIRRSSDPYLNRIERYVKKAVNEFCKAPSGNCSSLQLQLLTLTEYINHAKTRIITQQTVDALAMPILQLKGKLIDIACHLDIWRLSETCQNFLKEPISPSRSVILVSRRDTDPLTMWNWQLTLGAYLSLLTEIIKHANSEQMRKLLNETFVAEEVWLDLTKAFLLEMFLACVWDEDDVLKNRFSLLNLNEGYCRVTKEKALTEKLREDLLETVGVAVTTVQYFASTCKLLKKTLNEHRIYRKSQDETQVQKYWLGSIRKTLNGLTPIFHPVSGLLSKYMTSNGTVIESDNLPLTHVLTKSVLKLTEKFFSFGHRCAKFFTEDWAIFFIRTHYLSFIKLYNKNGNEGGQHKTANELAKQHLKCLWAIAAHRNEETSRDFYKMRCVEFLTREIDLEYDSSLPTDSKPQTPSVLQNRSTKLKLKLDLSKLGEHKKEPAVKVESPKKPNPPCIKRAKTVMGSFSFAKMADEKSIGKVYTAHAKSPKPVKLPAISGKKSHFTLTKLSDKTLNPSNDNIGIRKKSRTFNESTPVQCAAKYETVRKPGSTLSLKALRKFMSMKNLKGGNSPIVKSGKKVLANFSTAISQKFKGKDQNTPVVSNRGVIMLKDLETNKIRLPKGPALKQEEKGKEEDMVKICNENDVEEIKEVAPKKVMKKPFIPKLALGGLPWRSHDPNEDLKIGDIPKKATGKSMVEDESKSLKKGLSSHKKPQESQHQNYKKSTITDTAYLNNRKFRGIYKDTELHTLMVGLLFCLLLTPKRGTLDELYCSARPSDLNKPNVLYLLHFHLNHPLNAQILPSLYNLVRKIKPPLSGRRLLNLLCKSFFDPSLYSGWRKIATGAYATVFECDTHLLEPKVVAIKRLSFPKTIYERCVLYDIFNEITALEEFRAQSCVTTLYDYGVDDQNYYIVMKRYANCLREWRLMQTGGLNENLATYLHIYMGILKAVEMIHLHNITHYDLKCDNIMLDMGDKEYGGLNVTLGDFGECKLFTTEDDEYDLKPRGTECIKSPEMLTLSVNQRKDTDIYDRRKKVGTSRLSDVWSLGCLFYELITGNYLFSAEDYVPFYLHLTAEENELLTEEKLESLGGNTYLIDFLRFVLNRSATRRPNIHVVLNRFKHVHALLVNSTMSPMICTKSSEESLGIRTTFEELLESCASIILKPEELFTKKKEEKADSIIAPGIIRILRNLYLCPSSDYVISHIFKLIHRQHITHVVISDSKLASELQTYFELHVVKPCIGTHVNPYNTLPGIVDFCRRAGLQNGILLFVGDSGGVLTEALVSLLSYALKASEYETWTFVNSQTLFMGLPRETLVRLNRWVNLITQVEGYCDNYPKYSCICGCCSFLLTRIYSNPKKLSKKDCSCSALYQSSESSNCPGTGCAEHVMGLKEKYGVKWESVLWGFFDQREDFIIGPSKSGVIKDLAQRKVMLHSDGPDENSMLCGTVEKNASDWSSTRRTERWNLYKCKNCHMWTHAISLDDSRVAIVLNCPISFLCVKAKLK